MIIELEMLQTKLAQLPDFPPNLKTLLEHLIISHHGQYDFGSPKLPMFPEALMLHYLDDLDSKMEAMRAQFQREADQEGPWTSYNASMGRPLLNSASCLNKRRCLRRRPNLIQRKVLRKHLRLTLSANRNGTRHRRAALSNRQILTADSYSPRLHMLTTSDKVLPSTI
jgi:hypothetical protein